VTLGAAAVLSLIVLGAAAAPGDARVETVDARLVAGRVEAVSADHVTVRARDGAQRLDAAEVVEIVFAEPADAWAEKGRRVLVTQAGDRIAVSQARLDGKTLRLTTRLLGDVTLRPADARALYLPTPDQTPGDLDKLVAALELPPAAGDRLIVDRRGTRPLAVDGVLEAIGPEKITFRWKDASRKIARADVRLIELATVAAPTTAPKGVLHARDGSTLGFTRLALTKGKVTLASPALGPCTVAQGDLAAIRYASGNVVRLSERKPDAVKEHGFFGTTFRHRLNRSVAGRPLRLGGRTYRTGLGLHSYCELLYQLDGQYAAFVATVGIDDAVRPHGDATLHFLGDGRPLTDPIPLTGKTDPRSVRLDLKGVDAFLIRVDFGTDGLGFADHVNLAGARLLKD